MARRAHSRPLNGREIGRTCAAVAKFGAHGAVDPTAAAARFPGKLNNVVSQSVTRTARFLFGYRLS